MCELGRQQRGEEGRREGESVCVSEEKEFAFCPNSLLRAQRWPHGWGSWEEARGGHGCGEERGSARSVGNSCGLTLITALETRAGAQGLE